MELHELWYGLLLGLLPYRLVWRTHATYGWLLEAQALTWHIRLVRRVPLRAHLHLHLPFIQHLRMVVQRDRGTRPPDGSTS